MKHWDLVRYYEIQTSLLRLTRRAEELTEEVKQAKFDLRSRNVALVEYTGGFRSFLDGLTGKREDRLEALRRNVRREEAGLDAVLRKQQEVDAEILRIRTELAEMPEESTLRSGMETEWAELEVKYCAEALAPLLEEHHRALLAYRSLLRGEYPVLSVQRQQEIRSEPDIRAKKCVPWLLRLKEALDLLEVSFDMGDYYRSPASYLVTAAQHNHRDQVNKALDQVERVQKMVNQYR